MTDPHEEHGEILRRALNAEADTVTPSTDGLDRIRARIEERRLRRFGWAWFTASWARPVLAVGAAVAIAGIGVSAPQTVNLFTSPAGHNGPSSSDDNGAAGTGANGQVPSNGSHSQGSPPPSENGPADPSASPTIPNASSTIACQAPGEPAPAPSAAGTPSPGSSPATPPAVTCTTPAPPPTTAVTKQPEPPVTPPTSQDPEPTVTPTETASEQSSTSDSSGQTP
ncbi:hypothetical protein [Spirillospora sp. NPDC047279]|uniref:hypothetical protein n=1 Tax=Spirillospora sp. NPDC047279 TaxID=3155478 RepID=UPI0033D2BB66